VKGTEYFDGKTSRYVDYPLTDVLQMIGRAGRPGYSEEGKAVVMAMEAKKNFYKVRTCGLSYLAGIDNNMLAHLELLQLC
jgi:replicative superfamily II helicase